MRYKIMSIYCCTYNKLALDYHLYCCIGNKMKEKMYQYIIYSVLTIVACFSLFLLISDNVAPLQPNQPCTERLLISHHKFQV